MALSLQPPPPPPAPLSYTPPSESKFHDLNIRILAPFQRAIDNAALYLQDLEETPNDSFKYHILTGILDVLNLESSRPLWPVLYPSSLFTDTITAGICSIRADLNDLPNKLASQDPPPQHPPTHAATMATLDKKIDDLKKETSSSLKTFAEAVKASGTCPPSSPPSLPPKAKIQLHALKGNHLPQAVIKYRGHVDPASRPSFVDLVTKINTSLHNSPKHSHVRVVGVKWTSSSNLVVCAQTLSPDTLVDALKAIQGTLSTDRLIFDDIIPNVRWSHVTLSHVYTGKYSDSPHYDPNTLHEELVSNNPSYTCLTIRQPLTWVRNPSTFKDGQVSSISFAFEDPNGSIAQQLIGTSLTAFGNLRCTIKAWTPKKPTREK